MSEEQWFTAYDETSGDPYYYTASGEVTWERPKRKKITKRTNSAHSIDSSYSGVSSHSFTPIKPPKPKPERKTSKLTSFFTGAPKKDTPKKPPKPVKLHVIHAFKGKHDDELSIKKGAIVTGYYLMPGNEWWYGSNKKNKKGIFPCAFVERVSEGPNIPKPPKASFPRPAISSIGSLQKKRSEFSKTKDLGSVKSFRTVERAAKTAYAKTKPLQYSLFAHNLGYCTGSLLIFFGFCSISWVTEKFHESVRASQDAYLYIQSFIPYFAIGFGILIVGVENRFNLNRESPERFPLRSLAYVLIGIPCFMSYPTMIPGIVSLATAYFNYVAFAHKEQGKQRTVSYVPSVAVREWSKGQTVVLGSYFAINCILWVYKLIEWQNKIFKDSACSSGGDFATCPSAFAPFAKAFGATLNFNCAVILLPVLKQLLVRLNNTKIFGLNIASYVPLRKHIALHKLIAFMVLIGVGGHIAFHFLNFATRPEATIRAFGVPAWITGGIITLCMVFMYSGAQARVKNAKFEIFWFSHHLFVVFFAFLLSHGPVYWIWSMAPLLLYFGELTLRRARANRVFLLHSVKWSSPVLTLRFFPKNPDDFKFKEGQYLHIMINHLSKSEWHPFTMSSAFEDLEKEGYVSLHIRVMEKGSWTWRAKEFFRLLAGAVTKKNKDDPFVLDLKHFDNNGVAQIGKHLGPDGLPLISINGPHAAPAQHYSEYQEVMLIGAGIGLTPCAAIIKSILKYKWKKGFNPQHIRFYWVVRHNEIDSFRWFIRLLTRLQKQVIADRLSNALTGHHELEINLYVTSAPEGGKRITKFRGSVIGNADEDISDTGSTRAIEAGYDVDIGFSDKQLTLALLNPQTPAKKQVELQRSVAAGNTSQAKNKLKDIWVWNGRPDWNSIFDSIANDRRSQTKTDIGVVFCGAAVIGKDLKVQCRNHAKKDSVEFHLHKEKF